MFYDKSISFRIRWVTLGLLLCAICLTFVIFSITYFINSTEHLKETLIEEKDELVMYGLQTADLNNNIIFKEELSEIYMVHHISTRAINTETHQLLFETGLFKRHPISFSNELCGEPTFQCTVYDNTTYIQFIFPFIRHNTHHVLELTMIKPDIFTTLSPFYKSYGITFFILFSIAIPFIFWFSHQLVYPIHVLKERISILRSHNLSDPLMKYHYNDEVSDLIQSVEDVKTRLSSVFYSLSRYSSLLSHEIRNKLAQLQAVTDQEITDSTKRHDIHMIINNINECMDALKCIHLLDEDTYIFEYSLIKLPFLITRILEQFQDNPRLQFISHTDTTVETDTYLLKMILKNAIENALTHAQGPVTIEQNEKTITIKNACTETQYHYVNEKLTRIKSMKHSPKSSLGLFIISKFTKALDIPFLISFDKVKNSISVQFTIK